MTSDRITVPVVGDVAATSEALLLAAGLARVGGFGIELVSTTDRDDVRRRWVARATAAGLADVAWTVLRESDDLAAYALWSGTSLLCAGHRRRRRPQLRPPVPALLVGPRGGRGSGRPRRVVVGVGGAVAGGLVVDVAANLARRIDAELVLVEVFAPGAGHGEVPESAHLHCLAGQLGPGACDYDTLHDRRPAAGIIRFLTGGERSVVAVGAPSVDHHDHHHRPHAAGVVADLVRHAPCPVLVVPGVGSR